MEKLIRENIKNLNAYSSARDEFTEKADIFLDANENPFNNGINRYPDPNQRALKNQISKIRNISADNILLGNGSDEVLDIIMRTFCEPALDNIIICPPTYGMYKVMADINNVETKEVLLNKDFSLNIDGILENSDKHTKIVILCSPNNPTGSSVSKTMLESLLSKFNGVVLVDEAYIDFSKKDSALPLLDKYPNLIVSQTLSKAHGMAGVRVGMVFSKKSIIDVFNKVKPPYNINTLSQERAINTLLQEAYYKDKLSRILQQKDILTDALKRINNVKRVFSSDANFILVRFSDARKVYNYLIKEGIVVRDRSNQPLCANCLRITVGTEPENKILIEKLKLLGNE